jgi:hypothetical protein
MTPSDTPCSSITYDQLSDNSIGVIYNRNIFIKQATESQLAITVLKKAGVDRKIYSKKNYSLVHGATIINFIV